MAETNRLKFFNAHSGKIEGLGQAKTLQLYFALPAVLQNPVTLPSISQFSSLNTFRLFAFSDLLIRVLVLENRPFKVVERVAGADLVLYGEGMVTVEPEATLAKAHSSLKVGGVIFRGEGTQESLEVARHFTTNEVRYLTFGTSYRQPLVVSQAALINARSALERLEEYVQRLKKAAPNRSPSKKADLESWRNRFFEQVNEDFNMPRAMAVIWMLLQSNLAPGSILDLLGEFNQVLGLEELANLPKPQPLSAKAGNERQEAPSGQSGTSSGGLENPKGARAPREKDKERLTGKDGPEKQKVKPGAGLPPGPGGKPEKSKGKTPNPALKAVKETEASGERRKIQSSQQVRSFLAEADRFDFTVSLIAFNNLAEIRATLESLLFYTTRGARRVEIVVVDMGSEDGTVEYLDGVAASYANFRLILAARNLGEAAGRNLAIRQGRGKFMLLLDAGLTLGGDLFEALYIKVEQVGKPALFGLFPLHLIKDKNNSLTGFEPLPPASVNKEAKEEAVPSEALDSSLLCFRRGVVEEAGFMDEHFRSPYALGLDYSFSFKDKGFRVLAFPELQKLVNRPAGFSRPSYGFTPEELERQAQKNWSLFKSSWEIS